MTENTKHPIVQFGVDKGRINDKPLAESMAYTEKEGREEAQILQEKAVKDYENANRNEGNVDVETVENLEKLIQNHLLVVGYHVFQWLDFTTKRDDVNLAFEQPKSEFGSHNRNNGNPPYENLKINMFESLGLNREDNAKIDEHVNVSALTRFGQFQTSREEASQYEGVAQLGKVFIIKTEGKGGKGVVLLQGAFSTESRSSRVGGRTNNDNQIVWIFDTLEAADSFVGMFNDLKNSEAFEANTRTIEKSFRAMGIHPTICKRIEARLLLGQDVLKVNEIK